MGVRRRRRPLPLVLLLADASGGDPPHETGKGAIPSRPFLRLRAKHAFGREQLKAWRGVSDGSPQAERDFKFTRQATNKIGGISEEGGKFLGRFF